jgi:hypothetical protein
MSVAESITIADQALIALQPTFFVSVTWLLHATSDQYLGGRALESVLFFPKDDSRCLFSSRVALLLLHGPHVAGHVTLWTCCVLPSFSMPHWKARQRA